jgi:hypothetical protein
MGPAIARSLALAAIGAAAAASACTARPEVSSVGPQAVSPAAPRDAAARYLPAGTLFTARLDQPLDSFHSAPGSTFTATVVTPLRDSRGGTLVPWGARMHGTFVSSGEPDDPRILVRIDTLDTAFGTLPVAAALREAQHVDWVAPLPRKPNVGYALRRPKEVRVPSGALLELQLTSPLVLPRGR